MRSAPGRARAVLAALLVAVLAVVGSACNLQTADAPTGPVSLTATFPDAQGLVVGNTVQINTVVIGSVTSIKLDHFRARVTMSVKAAPRIPKDALATVRQSTLLGEYYVDIAFPAQPDPARGFLVNHDTVTAPDHSTPSVEQVVGRASQLIDAVNASDLSALLTAGAQAFGDRGPQLNQLIGQLSNLLTAVGGQSQPLGQAIDNLGKLGSTLSPLASQFGTLLDNLTTTTGALASDRDRFFAALNSFNGLVDTLNNVILEPHAQQLANLLTQANGVVVTLNNSRQLLLQLIDDFAMAVPRLGKVVSKGNLLMAFWFDGSLSAQSATGAPPVVLPGGLQGMVHP